MADLKYYDIIRKPVVTEKSMDAMGDKKYTFLVHQTRPRLRLKRLWRRCLPEQR